MRKFLCLTLALLMILSCSVNVFAEIVEIRGLDVINTVDGDGWHDENGQPFDTIYVNDRISLILHYGDWGKYDISSLDSGTYDLTLCGATTGNVPLEFTQEVGSKASFTFASTGSYGAYQDRNLGQIYIAPDSNTLKVLSKNSLYFKYMKLTFVSEDNLTLKTKGQIETEDVYSDVMGEGWWDNGQHAATVGQFERAHATSGYSVCLRTGEWVKYDISDIKPGKYNFSAVIASTGNADFSIEIDGDSVIDNVTLSATGGYGTYVLQSMGFFEIPENAKYLKVTQKTPGGLYVDYFTYEAIKPLECEFSTNTGVNENKISAGADRLKFVFTNEVTEFDSSMISVSDMSGNELSYNVKFDKEENAVSVDLKEALKFSTEYIVTFPGLTDVFEQEFDFDGIVFETNDKTDKSGTSFLKEVDVERNGTSFNYVGIVKQSSDLAIKGREVKVSVKTPVTDDYELLETIVSSENGSFEGTYTIDEDDESGEYKFAFESDFCATVYDGAYYYNDDLNEEISKALSGINTTDEFIEKAKQYENYLDVSIDDLVEKYGENSIIFKNMLSIEFESIDEVLTELNKNILVEEVNVKETADEILEILEANENLIMLGINPEKWAELKEEQRLNLAQTFEDEYFENCEELLTQFNKIADEALLENFGLKNNSISSTSIRLYVGAKADKLTVSFDETQNYVENIKIELDYGSNELCSALEIESLVNNASFEKNVDDGKISIAITPDSKENGKNIKDILSVSVLPTDDIVGEYIPDVNVCVTYIPMIESRYASFSLIDECEIAKKPMITILPISEIENDPDYVSSMKIEAEDIISDEINVGFSDNGKYAMYLNVLEKYPGTRTVVCLRDYEWVKYDISKLKPGKYKIILTGACTGDAKFDVEVDGSLAFKNSTFAKTGSYSDYASRKIGECEIPVGAKTLTINSTYAAIYFDYFEIVRIDEIACTSFDSNSKIADGKTSVSADTLVAQFNNDIVNPTKENITLKNSKNENVPFEFSYESKAITVNILKALENGETYTISFKNLTDVDGQTLKEDIAYSFVADGNVDSVSKNSISGVEVVKDRKTFTVSGTVLQSRGYPIEGRKIYVNLKKPGESEYNLAKSVTSDSEGMFSAEFSIPVNAESGKYSIKVAGDFVSEENSVVVEKLYMESSLDGEACEAISNKKTTDSFISALEAFSDYVTFDFEAIADKEKLVAQYLDKEYTSFENVVLSLKADIVREKINEATDAKSIKAIIEKSENCDDLGINKANLSLLSDAEKDEIYGEIFAHSEIDDTSELKIYINLLIDEALAKKNGLIVPSIVSSKSEVNEGGLSQTVISFEEAQENIKNITVRLSYGDDDKVLFENYEESKFISLAEKAQITRKYVENGIVYTVIPQNGTVKDILKASFTAVPGSAGTYLPTLSVQVTYSGETTVTFDAEIVSFPKFTVTKKSTSGNDYYTGGTGFGSGGGGRGNIPKPNIDYKEENITKTEEQSLFNDLGSVDWAKNAILKLSKMGIVSGRNDSEFAPLDNISRAEFCKLAVVAFGLGTENNSVDFDDVKPEAWYYDYVKKAASAGIILGADGKFNPDETITREDMAVILLRIMKYKNIGISISNTKFADLGDVSDYAKEAVTGMDSIMNGVGDNVFAPKESVNRAMAAVVIDRLLERAE